jgi:hypothetical protein
LELCARRSCCIRAYRTRGGEAVGMPRHALGNGSLQFHLGIAVDVAHGHERH